MFSRVFHTRLQDFELQAERLVDPSLATRAVAIITSPRQSGTIITLSGEAQAEGLRPGMRISLVRKMSPRTVLLPFNPSLYQKVQQLLFKITCRFSPVVEPSGYGQFFLDMSGMAGIYRSFTRAAQLLSGSIAAQVDLIPRVGISRNKLVSAVATGAFTGSAIAPRNEAPPAGVLPGEGPILEIPQGTEPGFLAPLLTTNLPVTRERTVREVVRDLNLVIIEDLQQLVAHVYTREAVFGTLARRVAAEAKGVDTSIVKPLRLADHIIERRVLPEDTNDEEQLYGAVQYLAEVVGYQLRRTGRTAGKVVLHVHYTDGYEHQAAGRLPRNDEYTVTAELIRLYQAANRRRNRIRAVTVNASRLRPYAEQVPLFAPPPEDRRLMDDDPERDRRLSRQLDLIRGKYGLNGIHRGTAPGNA